MNEDNKNKEYVESKKVIPILILMFLFGSFLGYYVHEEYVGYKCSIAFTRWNERHVLVTNLSNFNEAMDAFDKDINTVNSSVIDVVSKENVSIKNVTTK